MVQIVADSTCDISKELREKLGVIMVPLKVLFGDGVYKDGIDLTQEEFYYKLGKATKLPTTAQVNPGEFEDTFSKIIDSGDEVVCICISNELSGTYNSAVTAADALDPSKIYCVDTRCATFGSYLIINEVAKMRDLGMTAKEIAEKARVLASKIRLFAMVDTLKYLKMGGRLSGTAAMIGGILGIHPIISVQGTISVVAKTRGLNAAFSKLLSLFLADKADLRYGIAFGSANAPERQAELIKRFKPYLGDAEILSSSLGAVIGAHVGPGALGYAFISK